MKTSKYILIILVLGFIVLMGSAFSNKVVKQEDTNLLPSDLNNPIQGENPDGEADPSVMKLDMKTWVWISALFNDGKELAPKKADKFNLVFNKYGEGTFVASTDCNAISGKYKVEGNLITFSDMISTEMACGDSQEDDYRQILANTASYFFTSKGELILEQKFDSGTATFR